MDCKVEVTQHAVIKHREDLARYVGLEALDVLVRHAHLIYQKGMGDEVPEKRKEIEVGRKRAIVKYRCRTLRVVVAKTSSCYLLVTAHPYPERSPDLTLPA